MTRIKELREQLGIKQDELALLCNVSQSTVSLWEIGKTVPRKAALEILSKRFNVPIGYILGVEDSDEPDVDSIDLALSGEIRNMSSAEKQDVLDYILFKRQQKARQQ